MYFGYSVLIENLPIVTAASTAQNHHSATTLTASNKHSNSTGATESAAATAETGVCADCQQ